MSNHADLRAALQQARGLVASLEAALAELETGAPDSAPPPRRVVDTSIAMRFIGGRSQSWLYSVGRKHPEIGWLIESGSWRWDVEALRLFMAGRVSVREESDRFANIANDDDSQGGA